MARWARLGSGNFDFMQGKDSQISVSSYDMINDFSDKDHMILSNS